MSLAPLETARLRIREFEMADLETYHRLKEENASDDEPEPIEAAQTVIDFVFNDLHAACIVATTAYDNEASQRVMTRLGMRLLRNPGREPAWRQVCGVLNHPKLGAA